MAPFLLSSCYGVRCLRAEPEVLFGICHTCPVRLCFHLCLWHLSLRDVASPGDPQLEFCPIFQGHILCEAVTLAPDSCLFQTVLPRDLVCLTVFCLLSVLLPVCLSSDLQALGGKHLGCIHFYVLHRLAFYSAVFSF